jgi:ubiquinone/menaquinone biosynthesis C-methylase UbiE
LKLCVGCGNKPEGDVNIDLHIDGSQSGGKPLNVKVFRNFVLADGSCLPFRDGCFSTVVARHVLEHIPEPFKALKEWKRVSVGEVIVFIPSQYVNDLSPSHLYSWNKFTLKNLMLQVFSQVDVKFTNRLYEQLNNRLRTVFVNLFSKLFGFWIEIEAVGFTEMQRAGKLGNSIKLIS